MNIFSGQHCTRHHRIWEDFTWFLRGGGRTWTGDSCVLVNHKHVKQLLSLLLGFPLVLMMITCIDSMEKKE